jgi:hypothetical protein
VEIEKESRMKPEVLEALKQAHLALRDYEIGTPWNLSLYSAPSRDLIRELMQPVKGELDGN